MKAKLYIAVMLSFLGGPQLAARNPKLLFNDSTLLPIKRVYNNPSIAFPFVALKSIIVNSGSVTSSPSSAGGMAGYDQDKAYLAEMLAYRYSVETNAGVTLGDRAFYWVSTKYAEDKYVYETDNWALWMVNGLALTHYCIAFDLLCGAGYFDPARHPGDTHDLAYWNGLKQTAAVQLHDKAAAIYNRVKNFRTVGDAATALLFGNQTVLNEAKFHAQVGNHRIIVASALGVAAYLLNDFGYSSETDLWLSYAKKDFEQFVLGRVRYPPQGSPPVTVVSQNIDGAFPEGVAYLNYSGSAFIPFMVATRLNGGEDYFQDAHFKKVMDWCYNLQMPDGSAPQINSTGYFAYPINAFTASVIPNSSHYLGQLKRFLTATPGGLDLAPEGFSLLDSAAAASPVTFAPITNMAAQGELIMRNDAQSPTRYLLITAKNGPARYAAELHGYADAGSYLFQADGRTLVLHAGYAGYSDSQELERARAHSTICPVVADTVVDDAPNRDNASPPDADASFTNSAYTPDFSYAALTMELYGAKPVNASDEALKLFSAASNLSYEYGNSLHMTWKNNGTLFGTCGRKFLMVNNSYLVVRDDVTRTNAAMQYAVSYIQGNNGNNLTSTSALTSGIAAGANEETTWSAGATSTALRVNTAVLGGKIGKFSTTVAAAHQFPDPLLSANSPKNIYYHAAMRTASAFTDNYGQIMSVIESDPSILSKAAITTKRNADTSAFLLYSVDGRGKKYGRYDVVFSQKQSRKFLLAGTGLAFPIETDASFLVLSYGGDVNDTSQIRIFSNGATFVRSGATTFIPKDAGDAQTVFTAAHAPTEVPQRNRVPSDYALDQNFPNPFNPSTTIRVALPEDCKVTLQVINVLGQVVADLIDGERTAGWTNVVWNAPAASGMYFYRLDAASIHDPARHFVQVRRMIVLK